MTSEDSDYGNIGEIFSIPEKFSWVFLLMGIVVILVSIFILIKQKQKI